MWPNKLIELRTGGHRVSEGSLRAFSLRASKSRPILTSAVTSGRKRVLEFRRPSLAEHIAEYGGVYWVSIILAGTGSHKSGPQKAPCALR